MSTRGRAAATPAAARASALAGWALLGLLLVVVVGTREHAAGQEADAVEGDADVGATLYAQQCATCHGATGRGGVIPDSDRRAPPITGEYVDLAYWDLVVRTGRMPPPEREPFDNRQRNVVFDAQERAHLNAFAAERLGVDGDLPPAGLGDPGNGLEVYAANCAACHGPTGAGGVAGAGAWTPAIAGADPQTIASAVRVGPFEMPRFGPDQLTDTEVADVAAFLQRAEEEPGTVLGLTELNPVYQSGFVALLALALLASVLWISGRPAWFPDTRQRRSAEDAG